MVNDLFFYNKNKKSNDQYGNDIVSCFDKSVNYSDNNL